MCREVDETSKEEKSKQSPKRPVEKPATPHKPKVSDEYSDDHTSSEDSDEKFDRKTPAPIWLTPDVTAQNPPPLVYGNDTFGRNPLLLSSSDGLGGFECHDYFQDTFDSSVDEKIDRMPIDN